MLEGVSSADTRYAITVTPNSNTIAAAIAAAIATAINHFLWFINNDTATAAAAIVCY